MVLLDALNRWFDTPRPRLLAVQARFTAFAARVRTTNPYLVDAAIALGVAIAASVQFAVPRDPALSDASVWSFLLTLAGPVALVWRRRYPLSILFATNLVMAANQAIDGVGQPLPYAGLLAAYTVAAVSPLVQRMVMSGVAVVVIPLSVMANTNGAREYLFTAFTYISAYTLGRLTYSRQERVKELMRTRRVEADQAVAVERARIARDMHDVLSHAVSIMIVQAEAGPIAVRRDPERAEYAFDAIAEAGRDAMTQLRRMLGVLKTADAERVPQPGMDDLSALVTRVGETGPRTTLTSTGTPRPLPADMQVAVYRITQEALTNVVKHARASHVVVRLDWRPDSVAVTVTDDGVGPVGGDGGGHGMISFRERAGAHGGEVRCGPGPGGRGFQVSAEFPLDSADEARVVAG